MKTNELIFKEFIAEQNAKALTVEWVNWMLDLLHESHLDGHGINPAWLRTDSVMFHPHKERNARIIEPPMIYE